MLFFTSNINPMKKKNAKLLTTNSSITISFNAESTVAAGTYKAIILG